MKTINLKAKEGVFENIRELADLQFSEILPKTFYVDTFFCPMKNFPILKLQSNSWKHKEVVDLPSSEILSKTFWNIKEIPDLDLLLLLCVDGQL